ncbi:response regulator transcription factor [Xylophilus sp. GOD-11R]|uniref:response regulator transcription factor n=1 Tax=Xylophilus sp. GOD-11R TaxID=3089814 RepID=UPI00298D2968|nr:response regulator [Xylophilus sp. GOD-11R]WPB58993.1 response regulator [Xylophilus sp. GOD-11R]
MAVVSMGDMVRGDIQGKPTIGIVDDDESVRLAIGTLLRSVGFETRSFGSGPDFLLSHRSVRLDCLILDLRMRGMSGLEVQRMLRELNHPVPVIFVSAHGDQDARDRAMTAGAVCFLSKPFDEAALLACVGRALGDSPRPA